MPAKDRQTHYHYFRLPKNGLERFFSGYSGFPLSLKTNTFKFQFDLERTDTFQRVLMNTLVLRG